MKVSVRYGNGELTSDKADGGRSLNKSSDFGKRPEVVISEGHGSTRNSTAPHLSENLILSEWQLRIDALGTWRNT